MAKTFAQISREIQALQSQAAAARKRELASVIAKLKGTISKYSLTSDDLFNASTTSRPPASKKAAGSVGRKTVAAGEKAKLPARYCDTNGNSWTGRGSQPRWLSAAIAAGQTLESFKLESVGKSSPAATEKPKRSRAPKAETKQQSPVAKYSDGVGHSWSGRGPRPKWLVQALADGKSLEELAAA